jgi:hypothetical protein
MIPDRRKVRNHCCPANSLSLRDADRDAGGRASQDTVAGRDGERGSDQTGYRILHPLILSFFRREKGRGVLAP